MPNIIVWAVHVHLPVQFLSEPLEQPSNALLKAELWCVLSETVILAVNSKIHESLITLSENSRCEKKYSSSV